MSMKTTILDLLQDSAGASAVEYGLLLSGIGLALFGASEGLSYGNKLIWDLVLNNVNSATNSGTTTGGGTSA